MNLTDFLISPALRLSFTRFSRGHTFCCRLELGGPSRYLSLGFMRSVEPVTFSSNRRARSLVSSSRNCCQRPVTCAFSSRNRSTSLVSTFNPFLKHFNLRVRSLPCFLLGLKLLARMAANFGDLSRKIFGDVPG